MNRRFIAETSLRVRLTDDRIDDQRILNLSNGRGSLDMFLEHAAHGLYRAAGYPVSKIQPVAVSVNGEFRGVFSHIEPVNDDMLERHEAFENANDGTLYKALRHLHYHGDDATIADYRSR